MTSIHRYSAQRVFQNDECWYVWDDIVASMEFGPLTRTEAEELAEKLNNIEEN